MLWVTSADLSVSLCVYFYPWALEHEMMYQWKACSPALWIKMTVVFFQDLPLRSGRRNIHVEVPVLSVQRDVKVFNRLTLSFFHFTVLVSLSEETLQLGKKSLVWVQPFLSNDFRSCCGGCLLSRVIERWKHTNLSLWLPSESRVNKPSNTRGVH